MAGPSSIFNQSTNGSGTVGSELWVDMGAISTGDQIWWGYASYAAPDKTLAYEIRGNNTGKSAGTLADTTLYSATSVRAGNTASVDLYRKGRLILRSVVSTGVEHWWIRLKAKSGTSGSYLYTVYYTVY